MKIQIRNHRREKSLNVDRIYIEMQLKSRSRWRQEIWTIFWCQVDPISLFFFYYFCYRLVLSLLFHAFFLYLFIFFFVLTSFSFIFLPLLFLSIKTHFLFLLFCVPFRCFLLLFSFELNKKKISAFLWETKNIS